MRVSEARPHHEVEKSDSGAHGPVDPGCETGPELAQSTPTDRIADVKVGEALEPVQVEARVGNEVSWINTRSAPVRIVFDPMGDRVSCQKGFKFGGLQGMLSAAAREIGETTIAPNQYASLCFLLPGSYTYNARMVATVAGGEINAIGTVRIE
jgi:hypothetical protein